MGKKKIVEQNGDIGGKPEGKASGGLTSDTEGGGTPAAGKSRKIQSGVIYIKSSYNNTVITVTDLEGNVITWASAGSLGFSGPKKATPFASSKIVATIAERLKTAGLSDIKIVARGVGSGRDSAIRSLINQGFNVLSIKDVTPIPHNGPRPPKVRRV